jgi:Fe-S-cluster containining protein
MTEPGEEQARKQELPAVPGRVDWGDDDFGLDPGQETHSDCRCGECCRKLIIEVEPEDAEREPKIKELCDPIYFPAEFSESGKPELEGYLLNKTDGDSHACTFLDERSNLCTIYETRPWTCRVFDCDGKQREELVQLGILPPRDRGKGRAR